LYTDSEWCSYFVRYLVNWLGWLYSSSQLQRRPHYGSWYGRVLHVSGPDCFEVQRPGWLTSRVRRGSEQIGSVGLVCWAVIATGLCSSCYQPNDEMSALASVKMLVHHAHAYPAWFSVGNRSIFACWVTQGTKSSNRAGKTASPLFKSWPIFTTCSVLPFLSSQIIWFRCEGQIFSLNHGLWFAVVVYVNVRGSWTWILLI
jgi:hypothetical protein